MKGRRLLALCAAGILLCVLPLTLRAESEPEGPSEPKASLSIVATVFPGYDFARAIAGEFANVRLLLPPGSESHSFEPTPRDMIDIDNADLFVYVGGESEHWVEKMLQSTVEDAQKSFAMLESVNALEEEFTSSMQGAHAHETQEEHEEHEAELDEHVWTSPKNAVKIVRQLTSALCEIDPAHADAYRDNADGYLEELSGLDHALEDVVQGGKRNKVIFGDRFPFRYLAHDYGIVYDAAFPGCSEDSEPGIRTVISLIDQIREEQIPVVFTIEFSSQKTAGILVEETGAKILPLHSCHNVSAEEMAQGATYLSLMWGNVEALREALN